MRILITGASGGIGKATAQLFLHYGHEVHGLDITAFDYDPVPLASETPAPGKYTHHTGDVCDPATFPKDLFPEILINCAGVQNSGKDIEVNLQGTINICERFAVYNPDIKAVVNISSASAHTGSELPEYAASKGGVMAYTKNLALRLAPNAICNSIDPGGVRTDLNEHVMGDPKLWDQIMDLTPMKRWAEPEEIAQWIYFVSVINRSMTGQNLLIDNGEAGYSKFIW